MRNKNFFKYYFGVDFETQIEAAGLDLEGQIAMAPGDPGSTHGW
jgi:predicted aconitase with swiveling domain